MVARLFLIRWKICSRDFPLVKISWLMITSDSGKLWLVAVVTSSSIDLNIYDSSKQMMPG